MVADDFTFGLWDVGWDSGYPTDLVEASISGVPDALQNLNEAGAQNPVVKVTVALTESGLVSVSEAVMHGEIKDESLTGESSTGSICLMVMNCVDDRVFV